MDVFWCARNDSKQQVRMNLGMKLIRMNLGMKLYFFFFFLHVVRHTQIHLFDSVHSYWRGQADLGLPKVILGIKTAILQD